MSSNERLTLQELSWLLAQEARGAARALRDGVTQLRQPTLTNIDVRSLQQSIAPVETNLDALDDAITQLSDLQATPTAGKGRRGRIDLAALLLEIAPGARIAMAPGEGTEVFGEESELRRLLHVLVAQCAPGGALDAAAPELGIRRDGDSVRIDLTLGPDGSGGVDLERRWLSRMAVRHGGTVLLEGNVLSVQLPADGATDQREVVQLRKELEQAQQLGEAYARELAAVFTAGDAPADSTPFDAEPSAERLETLVGAAGVLSRNLRALLDGVRADAQAAQHELGETSEIAQALARRAASATELSRTIARIARVALDEAPTRLDVATLLAQAVTAADDAAHRREVSLSLEPTNGELPVESRTDTLSLLLRSLVDHAIAATPRGGRVAIRAFGRDGQVCVEIADAGPALAATVSSALLRGTLDPGTVGRPDHVGLVTAFAAARRLGANLGLEATADGARTRLSLPAAR